MEYLKKAGISFIYISSILLILTFIMTLLNYFNIIGPKIVSILKIIISITSIFIGGYIIGKKSKRKGLIEGLKMGIILTVILVLFNYLGLHINFSFKNVFYYIILILVTIFGSIIGINKNIQEKQ